jgi:hypothetical protein
MKFMKFRVINFQIFVGTRKIRTRTNNYGSGSVQIITSPDTGSKSMVWLCFSYILSYYEHLRSPRLLVKWGNRSLFDNGYCTLQEAFERKLSY